MIYDMFAFDSNPFWLLISKHTISVCNGWIWINWMVSLVIYNYTLWFQNKINTSMTIQLIPILILRLK